MESRRLSKHYGNWGRGRVVPASLALLLVLPLVSAYAESFTVTANKDLYTTGEKAIIVGIIPDTAPEGYAVLLRVTGPDGSECAVQNVLPDSDNSFVSRPLVLEECGTGVYTVVAYYADISTNSTFTVSNSTQTGSGNRLELRLLKNVAIQAQETVNKKLREYLDSNQVLPEDIADSYSLGVFEASLVLQAIDFGNAAEAKKHLIFTVKHFREVLDSLSAERIMIEQALIIEASNEDGTLEKYKRLKEFYFRLEELSQKNGAENENEFDNIVALLARAKQLIDENSMDDARANLAEVDMRLEAIRKSLYAAEAASDQANSTLSDVQARRLSNVADKFERDAQRLLDEDPSPAVNATLHEVLGLISSARSDIANGDYTSARSNLSAAFSALDEAEKAQKNSEQKDNEGRGSASGGGGSGKDKDDNDNRGNSDDDEDQ